MYYSLTEAAERLARPEPHQENVDQARPGPYPEEQPTPSALAEYEAGWWEAEMDASIWWGKGKLSAEDAANLLCGLNPLNPDADYHEAAMPSGQTWGTHSKRLLLVFGEIERSNPGSRTLGQWLQASEDRHLPYHPWIDEWLDAKRRTEAHVVALPSATATEAGWPSAGMGEEAPDTGLRKREQQIRAIERMTGELKYPRMEIPVGGKKRLQSECMARWPGLFGAGKDPFLAAWKAAVSARRIRIKDHAKYSSK